MPARDEAVETSVEIAAKPSTVFRCLTQSDLLSRWLAAEAAVDPRVGGAVRIDFARHGTLVEGEVVELAPDERIAFTWGITKGPQAAEMPRGSTLVTISVAPSPRGSLVTLRHAGLPSEESQRDHEGGWSDYLAALARVAGSIGVRPPA